ELIWLAAAAYSSLFIRCCVIKALEQFDGYRQRFTATDAERCNAALLAVVLKCVHQCDDDARAGRSDWMALRAAAAMHVDFRVIDADFAHRQHRHHREGFV